MKVNSSNKRNISFNSFWNSKPLKKGLEFAAKNGTLFAGTTTLFFSTTVRPLAILTTPKTEKKNKKSAFAKSITSTGIGYLLMLAFSLPLAISIENIEKNPAKYLSKKTIDNLTEKGKTIKESKAYSLATQLFKLGLGFIIAAPKAIITAFCTPHVLNYINKPNTSKKNDAIETSPSFKGSQPLSKGISKILNKESLQSFAKKYKNSNFPMHIVAATDALTTTTFIKQTSKNKKLNNDDKKNLIYNAGISTSLSIITSYLLDRITKKQTEKIAEKIKKANANDAKLTEYLEGLKIAKPILIMAVVYYLFIPIISTFIADKIEQHKK